MRPPLQVDDVYMVFEYLEYDLWALANSSEINLTPTHVRTYMRQLLDAIAYMHKHKVRSSVRYCPECWSWSLGIHPLAGRPWSTLGFERRIMRRCNKQHTGVKNVTVFLCSTSWEAERHSRMAQRIQHFCRLSIHAGNASRPQVRESADWSERAAQGIVVRPGIVRLLDFAFARSMLVLGGS